MKRKDKEVAAFKKTGRMNLNYEGKLPFTWNVEAMAHVQ